MDLTQEEQKTVDEAFRILKTELEIVEGSWNGDESGIAEERAGTANEAQGVLKELQELINEL